MGEKNLFANPRTTIGYWNKFNRKVISFFWGFSTVKSFTVKAKGICRSTFRRILLTLRAWECNVWCNIEIGNFNRNVLSKIFVWEFRIDIYVLNISATNRISFSRSIGMLGEIVKDEIDFIFDAARIFKDFQDFKEILVWMHIILYSNLWKSL